MRARLAALFLCLALALPARPALALESAPARSPRGVATLISDADSIAPGRPLRLALRLRLAPGWHSYWQNPGDAGAAPSLDLTLPGGTAGPIGWPLPRVVAEGPLVTYAYEGEVVLPLTVTGAVPGHLTAEAQWLACRDICVPEQARLVLDLPAGPALPSAEAPLFAQAEAAIPVPGPFTARIGPDAVLTVTGPGLSPAALREAYFFPAEPGRLRGQPRQRWRLGADRLRLDLAWADSAPRDQPVAGVLALTDGAGRQSGYLLRAMPGPASGAGTGLAAMLGLALLGGLVLNLMPCVFPVLAMKAMALAGLAGAGRRQVRAEALSYTLGVLVAFAALGGLTLGLRAAGLAAGWGFQYAAPAFVAATGWVLFAVGLALSGVLEIGGALAGAGQGLAARRGHLGSFFTGLLAVVVATPCTAPFMGAALAASLTAPAPAAMATFLALGLGLAAPTLALALVPQLARALPRPGPWMVVLRQALAFPMYGAAVWLVWVASQQSGPPAVLGMLAGALLIGLAAWALGLAAHLRPQPRRTARAVAVAALLGAVALLPGLQASPPVASQRAAAEGAEPFDAARLAALRAAGTPVFVNLTAAWCVTCLINERVALQAPAVRAAFARQGVVYLVGDWTGQDPALTTFLHEQGRDGVPLYLYYPPRGGPAVSLPQILTVGTVLGAIGAAS